MTGNKRQESIPVHHLTSSSFLVFTIENTNDETFNGLHRHDFFELIWFTKSDTNESVEIDFTPHRFNDNEICLLTPGQVFQMEKSKQQGFVLAFAKDLFHELTGNRSFFTDVGRPISLGQDSLNAIQSLLPLIINEYNGQKRIALLKSYLQAFLFHVLTTVDALHEAGDSRLNKLFQLIDTHFLQQRETAFYAGHLNTSAKYLNSILKRERSVTIKELVSQRLVLEAKREIYFGELTLKEIAFKLGFSDPAYFSRFFKVQTGKSAEHFKASIQRLHL
ncbi:AraC-like DNA-binding protein [Pontibacter ummariensis]|uniref:AraC-type DNA-binding protein n=1 Tax=Pontibacter ummariensis TaxID=1610492 RepID=A0A239IVE2_9BACT|nr:AraC family transcriptional regulator [Pontibacter ummariensis]PRY08980.1 AraC-like DNA-binding protein [Pontibacter ummariensis]SNS97571.1 AraC-type DNA-binding protein [Pontibacter ummariensis]